MYKPILIVPDVHGRNFWEPALEYEGEVVFLGDYLDPYSSEGISAAQALETFLKILDFKKQNPDRVTLLTGNHELHYYDTKYRCTRFNYSVFEVVHSILTDDDTKDLFSVCRLTGKAIFVHAGILGGWHRRHAERLAGLGSVIDEQLNRLFAVDKEPFGEVSYLYRGGSDDYGSPLWADFKEILYEREAFAPDFVQVVGHTQFPTSSEPIVHKNIRLIDNRRLYLLERNCGLSSYGQ
ncbi:MAG: metallophosphoesterase [Tannerellaceae bacterium]|jgi:hypothetical protein|nr:metallophosphoesterase [Tannerellaceae bacterium]